MAHRTRRHHTAGHAPRGPRYTGLELCSALLNIMGGLALVGGALLALAGVVRIIDNEPVVGLSIVVSGASVLSAGVIQIGLASGLTALRDIARNTYATAHPLR